MSSIELKFTINKEGIAYLKKRLGYLKEDNQCLEDALQLKNIIEKEWGYNKKKCNKIIDKFFGNIHIAAILEIVPEYFMIGACNVKHFIMILGQSQKGDNYYSGIIMHELSHLLLQNKGLCRFVEEVICFYIENEFHKVISNKTLDDLGYYNVTDTFHKKALSYVFYQKKINFSMDLLKIDDVISVYSQVVNNLDKLLDVENSLIGYLENNV